MNRRLRGGIIPATKYSTRHPDKTPMVPLQFQQPLACKERPRNGGHYSNRVKRNDASQRQNQNFNRKPRVRSTLLYSPRLSRRHCCRDLESALNGNAIYTILHGRENLRAFDADSGIVPRRRVTGRGNIFEVSRRKGGKLDGPCAAWHYWLAGIVRDV